MTTNDDDTSRPYKLPRPHQLENLSPDQVVAVVLRLAMEVSVLRDRLSSNEELLAEHGVLAREDIESYRPSKTETAVRQKARTELIESIINDLS
jgi:hypothetical protein